MKGTDPDDPRALIREAYAMELTPADARAIFLDWALGLPEGDGRGEIERLLARYRPGAPDHPMTRVLEEGLTPPRPRGRRRR